MTLDEIAHMAQKAGFQEGWANLWIKQFEQFAELATTRAKQEGDQEIDKLRAELAKFDQGNLLLQENGYPHLQVSK